MNLGAGFLDKIEFDLIEAATAAGITDIVADAINTANFNLFGFIVPMGTITAGAITSVLIEGSEDGTNFFPMIDDSGNAVEVDVDEDYSDKLVIIQIHKPLGAIKKLRLTVNRGTANAVVGPIIAIRANGRSTPVTQNADVAVTGQFVGVGILSE